MLNAEPATPAMTEILPLTATSPALTLARSLASEIDAHPRLRLSLDLRLARALALDIIEILERLDEMTERGAPSDSQ